MKKIIVIISLFLTSIFADSFLGKAILAPTLKPHHETKNYSKNIDNPPTKLKDKHSKYRFKKDNHRYDKRYKYFDYDRYGYYNNDGYYYGYFDATGYFFNNIFFSYNSRYSYDDRVYRRGYFQTYYPHHRVYEYHRFNNWNRVHQYREPYEVIYGYYYDVPSYRHSHHNDYRNSYYDAPPPHYYNRPQTHHYYRDTARMSTTRGNKYRNENYSNYHHIDEYRRGNAGMHTRTSSSSSHQIKDRDYHYGDKPKHQSTARMQLSR